MWSLVIKAFFVKHFIFKSHDLEYMQAVRICVFLFCQVVWVSPFLSLFACRRLFFPCVFVSAVSLVSLIVWFPRCSPLLSHYPSLSALFKPQCFSHSVPGCNVSIPVFPVVILLDLLVLCTPTFDFGFCILLDSDLLFLDNSTFDFGFPCVLLFWLDCLLVSTPCLWHCSLFGLPLFILFAERLTLFLEFHSFSALPALYRSAPARTVWPCLS